MWPLRKARRTVSRRCRWVPREAVDPAVNIVVVMRYAPLGRYEGPRVPVYPGVASFPQLREGGDGDRDGDGGGGDSDDGIDIGIGTGSLQPI